MSDVKIIIGKTSLTLSLQAWKAFLDAAAWTVDSGDHYHLLSDEYPRAVLREVHHAKCGMNNQVDHALDGSELLPEYGVLDGEELHGVANDSKAGPAGAPA